MKTHLRKLFRKIAATEWHHRGDGRFQRNSGGYPGAERRKADCGESCRNTRLRTDRPGDFRGEDYPPG